MEKTRSYEGLFVIDPDKEESVKDVQDSIRTIISENSGNIVREKDPGKRTLAYPIRKKKEALYYEVIFDALPSAIVKISRLCRINTDIMRTLIDGFKGDLEKEEVVSGLQSLTTPVTGDEAGSEDAGVTVEPEKELAPEAETETVTEPEAEPESGIAPVSEDVSEERSEEETENK